ncbi:uncharacterized protein LOC131626107 [Vicia villosa]|uniref:uncharacterized protein LOC131626107 n=1 Tax=Vicia villosa TaxID=3911 RepID=UPI00273C2BA8|nr:uncharacterized protein LOC131626107 [Vicia villosa]
MEKIREFSSSTGLVASNPKSKIYFGGVREDTQDLIQQVTGFAIGTLPFKYLGVPLASRKLIIHMCQPLIERRISRLNHWCTRILSYADRVQLVRSVLFPIANYWMQVFHLPKKIIHHVETMCRSFIWKGKDNLSRKAHVSWESMCDPVSAGRNTINLTLWSRATIGKMLWNLCAKADKLWIRWINMYYIKGRECTNFIPPQQCSWTLKCMFEFEIELRMTDLEGSYPAPEVYYR